MTGPKGNSEFCFRETPNVSQGKAEGNIEVQGQQNSLFPMKTALPIQKKKKNCEQSFA